MFKICLCLVPAAEAHSLSVSVRKLSSGSDLLCVHSQVLVNLEEGLGVSLVNKVPEELVFITLSGINVHFIRTAANEVLELSIQNIQVTSNIQSSTTSSNFICITNTSSLR